MSNEGNAPSEQSKNDTLQTIEETENEQIKPHWVVHPLPKAECPDCVQIAQSFWQPKIMRWQKTREKSNE